MCWSSTGSYTAYGGIDCRDRPPGWRGPRGAPAPADLRTDMAQPRFTDDRGSQRLQVRHLARHWLWGEPVRLSVLVGGIILATLGDRWRLRADPPGVLVKVPGVVDGNAQVFLAVPYTVSTGLGGSGPAGGPGRQPASWPDGSAHTVRGLSGHLVRGLLLAPSSEYRAAAFNEDETAALVGDRRSGSTATQSAIDANDHSR
jgi:hypothetical protein